MVAGFDRRQEAGRPQDVADRVELDEEDALFVFRDMAAGGTFGSVRLVEDARSRCPEITTTVVNHLCAPRTGGRATRTSRFAFAPDFGLGFNGTAYLVPAGGIRARECLLPCGQQPNCTRIPAGCNRGRAVPAPAPAPDSRSALRSARRRVAEYRRSTRNPPVRASLGRPGSS